MKIGLISDTHSSLDPQVFNYFEQCDEVWHAGDFGSIEVADRLAEFKPLKGVYGNIDGKEIRAAFSLDLRFEINGLDIWMTHIGGYPGRYNPRVRTIFETDPPDVFICGHSHILRVVRDKKYQNMLVINPGAAGNHGLHKIKTIIRFNIEGGKMGKLEAIELGRRGTFT